MVRQNKGERNYHVFYLLTGGSPPELQKTLKLNDEFKYLSQEADLRGSDPAKAFNEVVSAMKSIGFDQTELHWVWTLCAVIMKVGNITFGSADEAKIQEQVRAGANPGPPPLLLKPAPTVYRPVLFSPRAPPSTCTCDGGGG